MERATRFLPMVSRSALMLNRIVELRRGKAYVEGWLAAGDNPSRLRYQARLRRKRAGSALTPPVLIRRHWDIVERKIENAVVFHLSSKSAAPKRVLLFLHGGSFVVGPNPIEWLVCSRIARKNNLDVVLLRYPLAPEHTADDTLAATLETWNLVTETYRAENTAVLGALAGGSLAVDLLLTLRDADRTQPGAVILSSPWLDLTLSSMGATFREPSDLLLSIDGLRRDGEIFAGSRDPADPSLSPLFADLHGLAPIQIQVGVDEILRAECEKFAERLEEIGGSVELHLDPAGQHCGGFMTSPEGRALRIKMAAFLTRNLPVQ